MKIAEKAEQKGLLVLDRLSLIKDIEIAHNEFNLKLDDLLNADVLNFTHDIMGIQYNIDRKNQKMLNCFLPRYSKGEM